MLYLPEGRYAQGFEADPLGLEGVVKTDDDERELKHRPERRQHADDEYGCGYIRNFQDTEQRIARDIVYRRQAQYQRPESVYSREEYKH